MADRRGFLRGLATLPLIGGSGAILGKPTQAAVPVTQDMLWGYKSWLHMEHRMLSFELAGHDTGAAKHVEGSFYLDHPAADWHFQWPNHRHRMAGWETAPQPSTRAAVMLSAVGCPLTGSLDDG